MYRKSLYFGGIKNTEDMYTNDKINRAGEIVSAGTFKGLQPFYLKVVANVGVEETDAILRVRVGVSKEFIELPFSVGCWNPVTVAEIDVREEDLGNFRIFWGSER